jgi:hypothetical protein
MFNVELSKDYSFLHEYEFRKTRLLDGAMHRFKILFMSTFAISASQKDATEAAALASPPANSICQPQF